MAPRQYVDISHFRAPYKNWPYLGMGGFGQTDPSMPIDVSAPPVPDSAVVTPVTTPPATVVINAGNCPPGAFPTADGACSFTDPDGTIVLVDANGVRTLVPAAGIFLMQKLRTTGSAVPSGQPYLGAAVMTTAADKEMALVKSTAAGLLPIDKWVNAQLALGRSVSISTNIVGGLAALLGGAGDPLANVGGAGNTQLIFTAVSTKADEITAASQPGSALIAPSKLQPSSVIQGALQKAGVGPAGVALIALAVVGGGVLLITRRKKHAVSNRRRRSRR